MKPLPCQDWTGCSWRSCSLCILIRTSEPQTIRQPTSISSRKPNATSGKPPWLVSPLMDLNASPPIHVMNTSAIALGHSCSATGSPPSVVRHWRVKTQPSARPARKGHAVSSTPRKVLPDSCADRPWNANSITRTTSITSHSSVFFTFLRLA